MKQKGKLISILSALLSLSLLGACGGVGEEDTKMGADTDPVENVEEEDPKKESVTEQSKEETVELNELMEFEDHAEVIITNVEFTDRVEPSKPGGYTYYEESGENHTYLHIQGTFKSLEADTIDMILDEPISLNVKYQDKYNYNGFIAIEETDGSNFDIAGNVSPLSTVTFHYIISVPNEIESSDEVLDLTIYYEDQKYKMNVR